MCSVRLGHGADGAGRFAMAMGRVIAMRALRLDYQRSNTPVPWPGWGCCLLALAMLALMGGLLPGR